RCYSAGMELVERGRELAAIAGLMAEGGVLVVEGGAGIGKTALLEAAAARAAAAGRNVLRARGSELEGDFPFAVVRRLFERRLAGAAPAERRGAPPGGAPAGGPRGGGRVVRRPPQPVLADGQPRGARPGPAARDRRRALGRRVLAALAGIPGAADRLARDRGGRRHAPAGSQRVRRVTDRRPGRRD